MNEPVKYKRLKQIAEELNARLDELHIGSLSKDQLEELADYSRELYERLVVLRFKAYDEHVKGKPEEVATPPVAEIPVPEPASPESIPFKVREDGQVNLLDAIEEATGEQVDEEEEMEEVAQPVAKAQPVSAVAQAAPSLNEVIGSGVNRESLAEKLESTPISDLKKAISLNQRFQFARELFKGNNQEYEVSVEKLNSTSREDAMRHLNSLRNKYAWKEEDPVATDFIDLVERRHS
jgi:hypothetical protein